MARFLRTTTVSRLRPPAVTDTPVVFPPVRVVLTARQHAPVIARRLPQSELLPPEVVVAATVFGPVRTKLAPSAKQARSTHPDLRPPTVIAAATVSPPVKLTLTYSGKQTRASHWKLGPPTAVSAAVTFRPVDLTLVRVPKQPLASHWLLHPPTVILAATISRPVAVRLVKQVPRQPFATHSQLRPPATLAVFVAFIAAPVRVALAAFHAVTDQIRRDSHSKLSAPTAVAPPVVSQPVRLWLAPSARQARAPHSKLRAPAAVAAAIVFRPIQRLLAWQFPRPAAGTHPKLSPPAAVGASVVFAPVKLTLAVVRTVGDQIRRRPRYQLRPPAVTGAVAVAFIAAPVKIVLAATRVAVNQIRHAPKSKLQPPASIGAAVVFAPIRRVLAWQFPRPATKPHYRLSPPTIVGFTAGILKATLVTTRTIGDRIRRTPKSRVQPPTVISAATVSRPIQRTLAWQFPRPTADAHAKLSPPTVTGPVVVVFVAPAIRFTLVAIRASIDLIRRRPGSRLKPPSVISASVTSPPVQSKLAPSGRQGRAPHAKLRPPTAVSAPTVFRPVQRTLAWQTPTPARVSRSKLRPPTVVTPFFAVPIRVASAAVRTAFERIWRRLRPQQLKPGVVTPFTPPTESSYGLVFLSGTPVYEVDVETFGLFATGLAAGAVYTVAVQDEFVFGIVGSGVTVYTLGIDDYPAS